MFPSIHLGFADIPTYSTIFLAGFFIAIVIARKIAGRYRLAKEDVLYGAIYAAIGILIGSKLLYCLTRLPSLIQKWDAVAAGFDKNFMQTLLFLMNYLFGGLVFYGGLIGAFLGIFCYCKQYHLSYVSYMDVFAPLIPFVHGIGRIGCFLLCLAALFIKCNHFIHERQFVLLKFIFNVLFYNIRIFSYKFDI